jgi:hypothetical protein
VVKILSANRIADKIVDLLSNNRISMNFWKYHIPEYITDQHIAIVAQAKNLADGINQSIARKGIDIEADMIVSSREYQQVIDSEGKVRYDGYNY